MSQKLIASGLNVLRDFGEKLIWIPAGRNMTKEFLMVGQLQPHKRKPAMLEKTLPLFITEADAIFKEEVSAERPERSFEIKLTRRTHDRAEVEKYASSPATRQEHYDTSVDGNIDGSHLEAPEVSNVVDVDWVTRINRSLRSYLSNERHFVHLDGGGAMLVNDRNEMVDGRRTE